MKTRGTHQRTFPKKRGNIAPITIGSIYNNSSQPWNTLAFPNGPTSSILPSSLPIPSPVWNANCFNNPPIQQPALNNWPKGKRRPYRENWRNCTGRIHKANVKRIISKPIQPGPSKNRVLENDPLDEIFEKFRAPIRKQHEVVDLVDIESTTSTMSINDDDDDDDLILIDSDETRNMTTLNQSITETTDVTTLKQIVEAESEDDDVICLTDLETETTTNVIEIKGEPEEKISIDIKSDVFETSSYEVEESTSTFAQDVATAAMEDSLVKGTAQIFKRFIRHWQVVKNVNKNPGVKNTIIRICSYNILCQNTIARTSYLYGHAKGDKEKYLFWETRWPLLKQNFEHIDADIFGLQEVQDTHMKDYIEPLMTKRGYGTMWTQKSPKGELARDGCALFFRTSKFDYVFSQQVTYYQGNDTYLNKPQIGQILRLKCKETKKDFVIANTHILFNMKRGDIKLAQLSILLANIHAEMKKNGEAPLILLGDFNMDRGSPLFRFIVNSQIILKNLSRSILATSAEKIDSNIVNANALLPLRCKIARDCIFKDKNVSRPDVTIDYITHPFTLFSTYSPLLGKKYNQEVSTYHKDHGNPDFIFYSVKQRDQCSEKNTVHETPHLKLYRRVTLPKLGECMQTLGPWPNEFVPSDHIPLIVEFQLRGEK